MSLLADIGSSLVASAASAALGEGVGAITKAFGLAQGLANGTTVSSNSAFVHPLQRAAYRVLIFRVDDGGTQRTIWVDAALPENFQFNLGSEWSAPFAEGIISNDKLNMLSQMAGMKWSNQAMSSNFWTGSSEVSFSLPLVFTAESGFADVLRPVVDLSRLSLPSTDGLGFFSAPGPRLRATTELRDLVQSTTGLGVGSQQNMGATQTGAAPATAQDAGASEKSLIERSRDKLKSLMQFDGKLVLVIGDFMTIPSVVITDVSKDFTVLMSRDGVPMQVAVSVSFKTHQTPSSEDVITWYHKGASLDGDQGADYVETL